MLSALSLKAKVTQWLWSEADNLISDIVLKLNCWFNLGMHYSFLCGAYTVFRVYKCNITQEPWFKSSFPVKKINTGSWI